MFKNNIRFLRKQNNLSQNSLANFLGYKSFTTIQKWEDGSATPSFEILEKLAKMFSVSVESLIRTDLKASTRQAPILGVVRGGSPIIAEQEILGYLPLDRDDPYSEDYFYLKVTGDSMKGDRIFDGDHLYVKKESVVSNGKIGIVLVENEACVKRIFKTEEGLQLHSSNEAYPIMHFTNEEIKSKQIIILGRVIHNKINIT